MNFERYLSFIDQPVIITDRLFQVVSMNPAFASLFPRIELGETIRAFYGDYPALEPLFAGGEGRYRLFYDDRQYVAHVSFVYHGRGKAPAARCALLADVTETEQLLREAEAANELLSEYNAQAARQNEEIERRIALAEEAAAIRGTSMLLRDLHDTLGHSLTLVNALQKLALGALPDEGSAKGELREALRYTDIGIAELQAAGGGTLEGGLTAFFARFRASMKRAGLDVALDIGGEEQSAHLYMYVDLMRFCQEAATNSIRHGGATRLTVTCRFGPEEVTLRLTDNGRSTKPLREGNGLTGMRERVNNLFGDIEMGFADGGGFEIRIAAPVIADG